MYIVLDAAYVQPIFHISPYTLYHISCYLVSRFSYSCFRIIRVSNIVLIKVILYIIPKDKIKRCELRAPRWPQNLTTFYNTSSRKCCTTNFHVLRNATVRRLAGGRSWNGLSGGMEGYNIHYDVFRAFGDRASQIPTIIFRTQCIMFQTKKPKLLVR
jgi:hypothetical protein